MSVWFRRTAPAPERRSVTLPSYLFASSSYASVDPAAGENSLQAVALWATTDLISSLASELPIDVYSGKGKDRVARPTPGHLLDPAGDGHGLQDWSYQVLMSWLLRGNLYGEELARAATYPTQISLFHPDLVAPRLDRDGELEWYVNGRKIETERLVHRRVHPVAGRILGLSPVAMHAATIGLTLTSTLFGLQWFRDGAHPTGVLKNSEVDLDAGQARTAKERFLAALRGAREPAVLGKGWEYQQIQVNAEESQFLATQGYTEAQCARIFGPGFAEILGYESGGSLTYATVEGRSTHLLVYSMNKWLLRLERFLSQMLPRPQYVRINRDALLQSTVLDRYRAHELALRNRWKTVNEVRELEDAPPVDWGDEPNTTAAPAAPPPADGEDDTKKSEDGA